MYYLPIYLYTSIYLYTLSLFSAGLLNPFPVFPFQLNERKQAFVEGYLDMQRRIKNPKILDLKRSKWVRQEVDSPGNYIEKHVDSQETLKDLIDFILFESYAKDWKRKDLFMLDVDGTKITDYHTKHNVAFQPHEKFSIGMIFVLLLILFLISPTYFSTCLVVILSIGAAWILSYLYGVERINREHTMEINEKMKQDELNGGGDDVHVGLSSDGNNDSGTGSGSGGLGLTTYNGIPVHHYNLRKRC